MHQREQRDAGLGPDRRADVQPVRHGWVVRVEGGQDDVHVREGRDGQDEVGDPPAPRDRREDDAHREERIAVALVDAGRHHEEGERQDGQSHEQGQPVGPAGDDDQDHDDRQHQQRRSDGDRRDPTEDGHPGAAVLGRTGVVADPCAGTGQALAEVRRDERPWVVGVDREIWVAAGRHADLLQQPGRDERCLAAELDDRQAERKAGDDRGQEAGQRGREDPDRAPGPCRVAESAGRPQGPPDRDDGHDGDQDAELGLDDRGDDRVDGGPLRAVAPELAQAEQEEDDAERVDLAPHHAVEPGDRIEDGDGGRGKGQPVATTELADHRPRQPADRKVGQDRRDLDEVADAPDRVADDPDEPQDVEVARRVVMEEVAVIEAARAVIGEVPRPEPEGVEVDLETGSRKEAGDDEAEDEAEHEDHEDRADGSLRPGQP